MSLLLDALQRASQEKTGGARPPTGQASPSWPTLDTPLHHDSLSLDDTPHGADLNEPRTAEPVETPLATPSVATLSLEPLQESPLPPSVEPVVTEPVVIKPAALHAPPSLQSDTSTSTSTSAPIAPIAPSAPSAPSAPAASIAPAAPAENHTLPQTSSTETAPPTASTPAPSPTPNLARNLLNTGKTTAPSSHKRAVVLGGVAMLILCFGMAAYFFVDLESLFMPGSTLSVAQSTVTTQPLSSPPTEGHPEPAPSAPASAEAPQPQFQPQPQPPHPSTPLATQASEHPAAVTPITQAPTPKKSAAATPEHLSQAADKKTPASQASKTLQAPQTPQPAPASAQTVTPSSLSGIARKTADTDDVQQAYGALTQGRLDEAHTAYQRVLQTRPEDRDALLGLAYIAQSQGRSDEARNLYRRVLRQEPDNTTAQTGLLALMANSGASNANASGLARDLTERHPRSAAAYAALGDLMVSEGRLADAQQAYFKAVALEADNARYAYNLAVALDRLHKPEQALSYYERAITLATKTATLQHIPQAVIRLRIEQLHTGSASSPPPSAPLTLPASMPIPATLTNSAAAQTP